MGVLWDMGRVHSGVCVTGLKIEMETCKHDLDINISENVIDYTFKFWSEKKYWIDYGLLYYAWYIWISIIQFIS